jgi:hypothetical protein
MSSLTEAQLDYNQFTGMFTQTSHCRVAHASSYDGINMFFACYLLSLLFYCLLLAPFSVLYLLNYFVFSSTGSLMKLANLKKLTRLTMTFNKLTGTG